MKDKILSVILICLTFTAVVMIFNLWYAPKTSRTSYFTIDATEMPNSITHLIDIEKVQVVFEDKSANYSYDKGHSFAGNLDFFSSALGHYTSAKKITKKEFDIVKTSDCIMYSMSFNGTINQLITVMSNADRSITKGSDHINLILLSSQFNDRLFVQTTSGYFMITLSGGETFDFNAYITQIAPEPLEQIRINSEHYNANRDRAFNTIDVVNELDTEITNVKNILTRTIFGDRQDFVQELIDVNGATLMIYGYGEKTLKINRDGFIDYSQALDQRGLLSDTHHFYSALSYAYAVIKKLDVQGVPVYLEDVMMIDYNGIKGYEFNFYYRINDYKVINANQMSGIKVKVVGGELLTYKCDIKAPKSMHLINQGVTLNQVIQHAIIEKRIDSDTQIEDIKSLYMQKNLQLKPVYLVETNQKSLYFDAKSGEFLHYGSKK